ncbi:hypothetical protein [Roseateles paludis]|jgi:hypothetical protein
MMAATTLAAALAPARAADEPGKRTTEVPTLFSVGDRLRLKSNATDFKLGEATANAPAGTCLRITAISADKTVTHVIRESDDMPLGSKCHSHKHSLELKTDSNTDLKDAEIYVVPTATLEASAHTRYGWVYGPMVVPFKYFMHDHSIEPSQSLGMYLGYRISTFNRGISLVGTAGAATMKVSTVVDSTDPAKPGKTTKENSILGYSMAAGVLVDITREAKPFVAGLLIGKDFVGSNSALPYVHDRRWWMAFQLGWNL